MNKKSGTSKDAADKLVRGIKRKTRKHYSAEEKIRVVLAGLRGEDSIAALCRREGIAESLYYSWSKEFLEAGKNRLAGDTARQDMCLCTLLHGLHGQHHAHQLSLRFTGGEDCHEVGGVLGMRGTSHSKGGGKCEKCFLHWWCLLLEVRPGYPL